MKQIIKYDSYLFKGVSSIIFIKYPLSPIKNMRLPSASSVLLCSER